MIGTSRILPKWCFVNSNRFLLTWIFLGSLIATVLFSAVVVSTNQRREKQNSQEIVFYEHEERCLLSETIASQNASRSIRTAAVTKLFRVHLNQGWTVGQILDLPRAEEWFKFSEFVNLQHAMGHPHHEFVNLDIDALAVKFRPKWMPQSASIYLVFEGSGTFAGLRQEFAKGRSSQLRIKQVVVYSDSHTDQ